MLVRYFIIYKIENIFQFPIVLKGDGGGGLICDNIVTGIVSWGSECGLPNFPSVYVDIAIYNFWIDSTIVWNEGGHENIPTPTPTTTPIPGAAVNILDSMYLIILNIVHQRYLLVTYDVLLFIAKCPL